ncbi:MAG: hypothetical protein U0324_46105 [Polyangiales bacterium]
MAATIGHAGDGGEQGDPGALRASLQPRLDLHEARLERLDAEHGLDEAEQLRRPGAARPLDEGLGAAAENPGARAIPQGW